jgi:tetratricopeptide (TPR) repeat protein
MLVDWLKQRGRYDSAIDLMQGVVRDQPSATYFNRLGSLFISAGDSARAGDCYERALRLDSAFVPALYNQSVLLAARGESAAARVLAGRAYRLRPDLEAIRELYLQFNPVPGDSPRPVTVPNQ